MVVVFLQKEKNDCKYTCFNVHSACFVKRRVLIRIILILSCSLCTKQQYTYRVLAFNEEYSYTYNAVNVCL